MIIVDTNVISEAVRQQRNESVVNWLDAQVLETLYFTATGLSELRLGIEVLPAGKRKQSLSADVNALIATFFGTRILPFDKEAASIYGVLIARARSAGRTVSVADGQIGAIASLHSFSVATRDTVPFSALGVPVVNPWNS